MKLSAPFTTFALLAPTALAASLPACSGTSTTPCNCPAGTTYAQSVTFAVIGAAATDVKALISDCSSAPSPLLFSLGEWWEETLTDISVVFNTSWLGLLPLSTQGPDNQRGSTRTSNLPTTVGTYAFTDQASPFIPHSLRTNITSAPHNGHSLLTESPHEQLTELQSSPDGSFVQKFEQLPSTVPVKYTSAHGSFSGYWVTLESQSIFQYETAIVWGVYACTTGHPQSICHIPYLPPPAFSLLRFTDNLHGGNADVEAPSADYAAFHEFALANVTSVLENEGKVLGVNVKPFSIQSF